MPSTPPAVDNGMQRDSGKFYASSFWASVLLTKWDCMGLHRQAEQKIKSPLLDIVVQDSKNMNALSNNLQSAFRKSQEIFKGRQSWIHI